MLSAFVTGGLARLAVPGPDPMPAWMTITIGLIGSGVGFAVAAATGGDHPYWASISSFLAAVAAVVIYRKTVQKRPVVGPEALRFPRRGIGVEQYRERLNRAGIDPDRIGSPFAPPPAPGTTATVGPQPPTGSTADDPTENPAHYLGLLEELHDTGVLTDDEYTASRTRL